jgi:hypothetical protein
MTTIVLTAMPARAVAIDFISVLPLRSVPGLGSGVVSFAPM